MPISLYILNKEADQKLSLLEKQVSLNAEILTKAMLNILVLNGGDLLKSKVDAREMITILEPLVSEGLLSADIFLVSKKKNYHGVILAEFHDHKKNKKIIKTLNRDIDKILNRNKKYKKFINIEIKNLSDKYLELVTVEKISGINIKCAGRFIFSRTKIFAPINKFKNIVYGSTLTAIIIISILAVFFSKYLARPIDNLIKSIEIIGSGDFDYHIEAERKDEFGKLSRTINHLVQIVNLELKVLRLQNEDLRKLDQLKDEFLANISHELRTPLYGMIGLAESVIDGVAGKINKSTKHNLSLIVTSGQRLTTLVNDIIDFSLLKQEAIVLEKKDIDLYAIVKLVLTISEPLIKDKDISLFTTIKPEEYYVYVDENRLQQILFNIVGNSIKFTERGQITISAKYNKKNMIEIAITDTGIGIPKEKHEEIFGLFKQADSSIARSYGGSGIGLTITKKLVELHKGKIGIDNKYTKGARLYFTIKKGKKVQEEVKLEKLESLQRNIVNEFTDEKYNIIKSRRKTENAGKIYIVDDEPVNCKVMANHLSIEGFEVEVFTNGYDVLKKIENRELPDLILLDIMLPRVSGYDVCQTIREDYSQSELPIIMVTAKNTINDLIIGFDAGTNDYLSKPINKEVLLARVTSLISLKKSVIEHNELNILKSEISLAHQIQNSLLDKDLPVTKKYKFAVRYKPMYELGGDFYEIFEVDKDTVDILIADVSGHGIPAAFISAMFKVAVTFSREKLKDPAKLLENVNNVMCTLTHDQYVTAAYVRIDLNKMVLYQSAAGHWPVIINRNKQIISENLKTTPIGWFPDIKYKTSQHSIKKGDRIILYTDGIIEAYNRKQEMFGEGNFHKIIKNQSNKDIEKLCDKIIDSVKKWCEISADDLFQDDISLVAIDIIKNKK